jgi:hypothetical protein
MAELRRYRGDVIGEGLSRVRWYSICNAHPPGLTRTDCPRCMTGFYVSDVVQKTDAFLCRFAYPLWYWWHNRPNSKARRRLESIFPGLRPKGD